jgi:hypothetical protein
MRRVLIILNLTLAVLFGAFFAYTFVARKHLTNLARDFVTQRTQSYAERSIRIVEAAVKAPAARTLLKPEQVEAIERELTEYRAAPATYIRQLTGVERLSGTVSGYVAPVAAPLALWKQRVRAHFDATLLQLLRDLRIFSGTNVVAGLIAAGLAWKARGRIGNGLIVLSTIILVAVIFNSYMYVDDMAFFTIITRLYMGWTYPVLVAVTVGWAMLEFGIEIAVRMNETAGTDVPTKA